MMESHKYASNTNTITHGKTRNTQIENNTDTHKYKFCHWHSQPDQRRRNIRFFIKKSSRENGRNFGSGNKKKAPNVAIRSHLTGEETPRQDGASQKLFQGGKRGLKIEFLGASSFFDHPTRSFLNSPNYQSDLNAQFFILFAQKTSMLYLYLY